LKLVIIFICILILKSNLFYFFLENYKNGDFIILLGYIIVILLLFLQIADLFLLFIFFEILALLIYTILAIYKTDFSFQPFNNNTIIRNKYQQLLLFSGYPQQSTNFLNVTASLTYFTLNILITTLYLFALICFFILFQNTFFIHIAISLEFK